MSACARCSRPTQNLSKSTGHVRLRECKHSSTWCTTRRLPAKEVSFVELGTLSDDNPDMSSAQLSDHQMILTTSLETDLLHPSEARRVEK